MQWEYMVREFGVQDSAKVALLEEFLNQTGQDGWELVHVVPTPTDQFTHLVYLRRSSESSGRAELAPGSPANLEFPR